MRGASPSGLAGILPTTREGLIRPLLGVTRSEVCAYLRDLGMEWRIDASNADPRFARNRVRYSLLPALARDWNANLAPQLARMAEIAREEDRLLSSLLPAPLTDGTAVLIPCGRARCGAAPPAGPLGDPPFGRAITGFLPMSSRLWSYSPTAWAPGVGKLPALTRCGVTIGFAP